MDVYGSTLAAVNAWAWGEDSEQYKNSVQACRDVTPNYNPVNMEFSRILINVFDNQVTKEASRASILTNLAQFFKETAWTTSSTGWVANKSVVQNALMYAILVVQSLILFIAYVKRLFYVTILAMMAPIVVVMDFFNKI